MMIIAIRTLGFTRACHAFWVDSMHGPGGAVLVERGAADHPKLLSYVGCFEESGSQMQKGRYSLNTTVCWLLIQFMKS